MEREPGPCTQPGFNPGNAWIIEAISYIYVHWANRPGHGKSSEIFFTDPPIGKGAGKSIGAILPRQIKH